MSSLDVLRIPCHPSALCELNFSERPAEKNFSPAIAAVDIDPLWSITNLLTNVDFSSLLVSPVNEINERK